jgi:hypothetical protein
MRSFCLAGVQVLVLQARPGQVCEGKTGSGDDDEGVRPLCV